MPLPGRPVTPATIDRLAAGFAAAHQRLYGFVAEDEPMQFVTFRAEAIGIVGKADILPSADLARTRVRQSSVAVMYGCARPARLFLVPFTIARGWPPATVLKDPRLSSRWMQRH